MNAFEAELGIDEARQVKKLIFDVLESQSSSLTNFLLSHSDVSSKDAINARSRVALKRLVNQHVSFGTKEYLAQFRVIRKLYQNLTSSSAVQSSSTRQDEQSLADIFFDLDMTSIAEIADEIKKSIPNTDELKNTIDKSDILLISHLFPTTWAPMIGSLQGMKKKVCWIGNRRISHSSGYGVYNDKEIPTDYILTRDIFSLIETFPTTDKPILISGESFIGTSWKPVRVVAMYCLMASFVQSIRNKSASKNTTLILYDALKPIASHAELGLSLSLSYEKLLNSADRLIFNSNTEIMAEYLSNAYKHGKPALHFYRYTNHIPRKNYFQNKEIHIVGITVCLAEFDEPSRNNISKYILDLLNQKLHFHYYCDTKSNTVKNFIGSLTADQKKYFHPHAINKNQHQLLDEISQFDFGLNPSDQRAIAKGIASLEDRAYVDALELFWHSTIATSFLVYAAAGLPVILPRGCTQAAKILEPYAIPMNPAEYQSMRPVLENYIDSNRHILKKQDRSCFTNVNIKNLVDFIES